MLALIIIKTHDIFNFFMTSNLNFKYNKHFKYTYYICIHMSMPTVNLIRDCE